MLIIGHRGAAALAPENTLPSIERAMEIGVTAVEIDVRRTQDNEIVVIHDDTVDRTTNGTGRVKALDVDQIKRLDAGQGAHVPTLQEVVDLTKDRITVLVELKEAGTEEAVARLIKENDLFDSAWVISFWHRLVRSVKGMDHRIRTGVLMVGCPIDTAVAVSAGGDALVMKHTFVDQQFVDIAHETSQKVFVWNVDEKDLVGRYVKMGVNGIASNDPRILVESLGSPTKYE